MSRTYKICVMPGEGIGLDVTPQAVRVLEALPLKFEFSHADIGYETYLKTGESLPQRTIDIVKQSDSALFGAVTTPPNIEGYRSPIVRMRKQLDLFANVRPCRSYPNKISWQGIDMVIVRENTEDLYMGVERVEDGGNRAVSEMIITRGASEKIIRYAFDLAKKGGRKKVTVVHKANVLRATCGLFLKVAGEVAKEYPDITMEDKIVDATAMMLIKSPGSFDVIVTTNMFGDILSDEASMLVGGLGLAYSGNIGARYSVFEPVHGSAPHMAGQNKANPIATVLAAKFMLEHLGETKFAKVVEDAVLKAMVDGKTTYDLGGSLGTKEATDAIIDNIRLALK